MKALMKTQVLRFSGFLGALIAAAVVIATTGDVVTAAGLVAASVSAVTLGD